MQLKSQNQQVSLLIFACVFFASPSISGGADQIQMIGGARLDGKIVAASPTEVSIEVRGTKRAVSVSEIKQVILADEPPELTAGRARVIVGKPSNGLTELRKLDPSSVQSELVKRDLQFYLAFASGRAALSSGGDKNAAAQQMLAFVRANPTSFHFFESAELLGDLALAQGQFEQAAKYYAAISSKAPWPEYKMRASMSEARALIAQGEFAQAEQKYETVLADKSDSKQSRRQKLMAEIGKARCVAETGTTEQAIMMIEKIIAENDAEDVELFGLAYNAFGDILLKSGKAKDALMAYLHVDVLFYSDPEIHAEALYHLSKLWADINNNDRATAARTLLNERYSGSIWSSKP